MTPRNAQTRPEKLSAPGKFVVSGKGALLHNDIYEQLVMIYAIAPRGTKRAFEKVGILISGPADLAALANLHASGQDVSGFQGRDGKTYAFNVREVMRSIPLNKSMLAKAPIEFSDMVIHQGKVKIVQ